MKVSAAYLLDPGFRPEAAGQWANAVPIIEKQVDAQPESGPSCACRSCSPAATSASACPSAAVLSKRNFDEAKVALAPVIASAPIEITIVGDVDEKAAIDAVAASFGALPARKASSLAGADARKASFRADRSPIVLTHDGPADKALVEAVWPTTDDSNYPRSRRCRAAEGRPRPDADRQRAREARRQLWRRPAKRHVRHVRRLRLPVGQRGRCPRQDRRGPAGDCRGRGRASGQAD